MKYIFILLPFLCAFSTILYSQPGILDKSFGEGGIVIGNTYYGDCNDLLIQQDGKVVVIGRGSYDDLAGGFLLVRYIADGTPDFSFGDSGRVVTSLSLNGSFGAYGVMQEDGKIVVAGPADGKPAVIRYNGDGTIDSSFGNNGVVIQTLQKVYENPTGLAIQPDGKILVSGTDAANSEIENFNAIYIIRYNVDGSLDASFGGGGIYEEYVSTPIETAGIAVQPDGNILVGGSYPVSPGHPFFIRRYNNHGTPDKAFGVNGEAKYSFQGSNGAYIHSIALQTDGSIIAAGSLYGARNDGNPQSALVRFTADGKTDNDFGKNGLVTTQIGEYGSEIYDLALQPDGKIVAAATSVDINNLGSIAFAAVRYLSDGEVDSSFAQNGVQLTTIQSQPFAHAIALQEDGKIVLGGYSINNIGYGQVTLARYNGDSEKQPLIVRIKRWLQHRGISWQKVQGSNIRYYAVQRSSDGITYKEVAKINSKSPVNNYEDNAPLHSDAYYRIAAVGWDGSRTYSNTVLINDAQQARIFPNPARDNLQVQGLPANGKTNVSVIDFNGNVRSTATATGSSFSTNISNLSSGSYLLKIQHNGTTVTRPFVKE